MHRPLALFRPTGPTAPRLAATLGVAAGALLSVAGALAQTVAGDTDGEADVRDDGPALAATVDGVGITAMAVDTVARQLENDGAETDRETILDELIDMEVLAAAAEAQGLDERPAIATALRLQRVQTLANAWLADTSGELDISEDQLREEYERQAAGLPEREFRASHVLLDTSDEARETIAALAAGEDFATVAAERSSDPAGATGGSMGWVMRGAVDDAIVDALETLAPGAVANEPVETDFGFHVLRLDQVRGASRPDFAAVKNGLRGLVVRRTLGERVEALRDEADIEVR